MVKVYVAGAYSAKDVVNVLRNIGRGEQYCADLFVDGFAPYCPWHDKDFVLRHPEADFTVEQFYQFSIEWLKVCDVMFLVPGWENSKGTLAEIEIAKANNIPIYDNYEQLIMEQI